MLFVEPEWALKWNGKDHPYLNCSALQLGTDRSSVPYLVRRDDDRQLNLNDICADSRDRRWSSPSVKEC